MKRAPLLWVAVLFVSSIPSMAASQPSNLVASVSSIERTTEAIRQLPARQVVKVDFAGDRTFARQLQASIQRSAPDAQRTLSQHEWALLGLLPAGTDLHATVYGTLADMVLAFYDPSSRTLYIRHAATTLIGPERDVVANQYVHALIDQHFHLTRLESEKSTPAYRNSDAVLARRALVEGDAMLTQTLFVYRTYSEGDLKALVGLESRAVPPTLPRALARDVSFPYVDRGGYGFAQHLYREGGMAALDAAYRRLPQATYEVMYPNAYDIKWRPATVTMHGIAGLTGWTQLDDDVFGAFGYHLLIWQYLPKPIADRVVADYRGDRYIYLENGIQGLLVMRSRWTSHIAANRAKSTLFQALRHRFPNAPITNVNGTVIAGARMSVYLRAQGSLLVVVFAPDPSLARQAGTAPVT